MVSYYRQAKMMSRSSGRSAMSSVLARGFPLSGSPRPDMRLG